jgi:hypothetical protein
MSAIQLPWFGADDIARLLSPRAATAAIQDAPRAGLDPASDPARGGLVPGVEEPCEGGGEVRVQR